MPPAGNWQLIAKGLSVKRERTTGLALAQGRPHRLGSPQPQVAGLGGEVLPQVTLLVGENCDSGYRCGSGYGTWPECWGWSLL